MVDIFIAIVILHSNGQHVLSILKQGLLFTKELAISVEL